MKLPRPYSLSTLASLSLLVSAPLAAVDYNNAGGNQYWGNSSNWTAALPNGIGASARLVTSSTGANQILLLADSSGADASYTVGSFTFGSTGGANGQNYRLNNVSAGTGQLVFDVSSGNAALTFNNLFTDTITMQINTGILLNDNLSITMNRSGTVHIINGTISSGASLTTGITVGGTGTLQLGGANNYTGATTVNAGATVKLITGDDRLSTGTTLTLNGGASSAGTLDLNTRNQKIGALSGGSGTVAGTVTNNAAGTGTATLTVESTSVSSTFDGIIKDGATAKVALTKAGAGTSLTLTGDNTYSGLTTVNGGTLALGAADRIANTSDLVLGGGTFATGGFNETLDTLTLSSNSTIDFGSGASALVFSDSSSVTWSGTLTLLNFDIGTDSLKFGTSVSALSLAQLEAISLAGYTASLDSGGFVVFSAIPEPSTYALLCGGASVLIAASVRSRRRD